MDYYVGIENLHQDPQHFTFKEGREYGWVFDVIEPIVITKLMYLNDSADQVNRTVKLYKDERNLKELMYTENFMIDGYSWGFANTEEKEIILEKGRYAITGKIPHYKEAFYIPDKQVEFGQVGIEYITGLFQNINDVGWLTTSNVYLVSFEYTLK